MAGTGELSREIASMKRPRRSYAIESLEPRISLTVAPLVSLSTAAPHVVHSATDLGTQPLEGTIQGFYRWSPGAAGASPIVHLSGSGLVQPLGQVKLMGPLQEAGTPSAPSAP